MIDSAWELECTEMSSSGRCFGRGLDMGSNLRSGSLDDLAIDGGPVVDVEIKGATSLSNLTCLGSSSVVQRSDELVLSSCESIEIDEGVR